jgi:FG-GAP repeat/PEP-CTERM motif
MRRTNWISTTCMAAVLATCSLCSSALAGTWVETGKLVASDGEAEDFYGSDVAISGNTAIIGAPGDDDKGAPFLDGSGAAYVYTLGNDGSISAPATKLTASDGAAGDQFGQSVGVSGVLAIVGAYGDDDKGASSGSAYIFENDGSDWSQITKLTASDGGSGDVFGASAAISGSTAIVGAYSDDDHGAESGSAYIFENDGSGWAQVAKLTALDGAASDYFGRSVSISGSIAIVGSHYDDDNGDASGSAYIFENDGSGWAQVAKLTAPDGTASDYFGESVAISGNTAIVGAYGDDDKGDGSGSAYIFEDDGSGWGYVAKLTADDGAATDYFGNSVAISGSTAVLGASGDDSISGSAYIFEDSGSGWVQVAKVAAHDPLSGAYFGSPVSLSDNTALIGAIGYDDNGQSSGAAYIFNATSEPVPEPMSMLFFGTGVIGVFGFVARRRMQKVA